jgi:hypothetical protein
MLIVSPGVNSAAAIDIEKLAPTVRLVNSNELRDIRQLDWDAAIVFGDAPSLANHLYVVQFGGEWGGGIPAKPGSQEGLQLKVVARSRSVQFLIPDNLPEAARPLVKSLVGSASATFPNLIMWGGIQGFANEGSPDIAQPFLMDADNYVLAGSYLRPGGNARWWWLPGDVEHPALWAAAALADWHNADPNKFPGTPSWQESDDWGTPVESGLRAEMQALEDELRRAVENIEGKKLEVATRQQEEFIKVNKGERRLVTAQGDQLVDAVQAALEEIGFTVTNVDQEIASEGDRREDLRVQDPDNPDWIAIVEVRGYKRGAQLNDLLRIARFVIRFAAEAGKP